MKITNKTITIFNIILTMLVVSIAFYDTTKKLHFFGTMIFMDNGIKTKRLSTVVFDHNKVEVKTSIFQQRKLVATTDARYHFIYNSINNSNTIKKVYDSSFNNVAFPAMEIYRFSADCIVIKPKGQLAINNLRFMCLE